MLTEISELETKRAVNIIWNSARRYDFAPDFKAYTLEGRAELYLNCIIGAVRGHSDYPQLEKLLLSVQNWEQCAECEGFIWLGLENWAFQRELPDRPVLADLRREYAERFLRLFPPADDYHLYDAITRAHWKHVLGQDPGLRGLDAKILEEIEFPPELTTEELTERLRAFLLHWLQVDVTKEPPKSRKGLLRRGGKGKKLKPAGRYRKFLAGLADHPENIYGGAEPASEEEKTHIASKLTPEQLRDFIRFKFGAPIYADTRVAELEREICTGSHEGCLLHFTSGEHYEGKVNNAFEALQKQKEQLQIQKNQDYFHLHYAENRTAIAKLSASIRNSSLLYLQSSEVKSNSGRLNPAKVWRGPVLNDEKVFSRTERGDAGDLSVDLLLDASTSQKDRQETVANQAYVIAESLTVCGIPCRVSSFCSMTGYTVLHTFRSYHDVGKNDRIFDYVANGCNRDGLAIRTLRTLMRDEPYDNKLLIILSDAKPNDVVRMKDSAGGAVDYCGALGVNDVAAEVRRARADGISVLCVFTGADEDLPAAKMIYGRDFARITEIGMLADTVGKLLLNMIRNL